MAAQCKDPCTSLRIKVLVMGIPMIEALIHVRHLFTEALQSILIHSSAPDRARAWQDHVQVIVQPDHDVLVADEQRTDRVSMTRMSNSIGRVVLALVRCSDCFHIVAPSIDMSLNLSRCDTTLRRLAFLLTSGTLLSREREGSPAASASKALCDSCLEKRLEITPCPERQRPMGRRLVS